MHIPLGLSTDPSRKRVPYSLTSPAGSNTNFTIAWRREKGFLLAWQQLSQ